MNLGRSGVFLFFFFVFFPLLKVIFLSCRGGGGGAGGRVGPQIALVDHRFLLRRTSQVHLGRPESGKKQIGSISESWPSVSTVIHQTRRLTIARITKAAARKITAASLENKPIASKTPPRQACALQGRADEGQ
jgi:hypothetical protein